MLWVDGDRPFVKKHKSQYQLWGVNFINSVTLYGQKIGAEDSNAIDIEILRYRYRSINIDKKFLFLNIKILKLNNIFINLFFN